MRKVLLVLCLCCMASWATAALVEDFQAYAPGALQAPWNPADGPATIAGGGSFAEKYLWAADGYALLADLGVANIDAADTATTLFFRTMTDNPNANCVFGIDDFAGDGEWDSEYYIQWNAGVLQARDNSGGQAIVSNPQPGVWYNVWFVINNAANTYRVFVSTGAADATAADEKYPTDGVWNPRGGTSGTLQAFNCQGWSAPIAVDDIHIWPGIVLTNPAKSDVAPSADPIEERIIIGEDFTDGIINPGFAQPGTFTNTNWNAIPGWTGDQAAVDSGVQNRSDAPDGDSWCLFHRNVTDPGGVWQVTDVNVAPDVPFTLEVMMQDHWGGGDQGAIGLFYLSDAGVRTMLASQTQTGLTTTEYVRVTTEFSVSADHPAVGKKIGILLWNPEDPAVDDSITGFDAVKLYNGDTYLAVQGVTDHVPANGAEVVPGSITLGWTPCSDPNTVSQTLVYYVGHLADYPDIVSYNTQAVSVPLSKTDAAFTIGTVGYDQAVLWRIDTMIDATVYTGETVSFTTQPTDEAPVVDAGSGYLTWVEGLPLATLAGTVDDFGEGDIANADVQWSVTSALPWVPSNTAMQMFDRSGNANLATLAANGFDPNLCEDWIGTDARGLLATSSEPLVLTLSGVPAGTYEWTSYHYDAADQTGPFDVTVVDAAGTATTAGVDVANGAQNPTVFTTTLVSNGGDIQLWFDNMGTDNSTQMFVMNGFVLGDGVHPDLAVDFGTPTTGIAAGWQAYTASHEVAATFTEQAFGALGTTVTVLPRWGTEAAGNGPFYAEVTKTSTDPLAPTATFDTNWNLAADYTITLTASDTNGSLGVQSDSDTLTVRVAADACAAALLNGAVFNHYDADEDCDVDMADFAAFAEQWLNDIRQADPFVIE